jgi:hypothetical protein
VVRVNGQSHGLADASSSLCPVACVANGIKYVTVAYEKREYVLLGFLFDREPVIIVDLKHSVRGLYTFGWKR